ncbi:MAG: ATP-binding protein [Gemmatimonadales bacterium]
MIRLRTLGTAEVVAGEQCITPDSAMMFGLALFLSVSAGQRVHRARLLDIFWPDAPDESRRHALRQLLYRLRRDGFPLSMDGEELLVEESVVESDVRRVLDARWPDEATGDEVRGAVGFLSGYDPLMPELYREWLDELRSRVRAQYRRALLRQIDAARRDGQWAQVDEWARRCLDADPLNEEATLAHAEAVAMSGSKVQALQIIDRYLDELGDRNRVIGLPAKVLRRRVSENAPERSRGDQEGIPLIGREREIAKLNDTLRETLKGQSTTLFIIGAAGIGKSRIARELVATAGMRGWRSCSAQLQASDVQRPLGVCVDLFGALLQQPGALGCSPASLAQLRLLTEHDVGTGAEPQRSQEAEAVQERLRRAAGDLLESVVSEGPLVLVIDDVHWCDDASLRLLQHLIVHCAALPVMWTLTARHEGKYEAVREALADVKGETMRLSPLSPERANELFGALSSRSGGDPPAVSAELTTAVTGGNPLFVLELARHVRETRQASSLPQSLRALIRDRAARLSPTAQHVLHTCAVLGRYSSVPRVAGVLEIGTGDLLGSIEELDALGIVGAGRAGEALSIHDLWRDELLSALLPAAEKLLHHRCGLVLEAECRVSRSPSMVWEAARHLLASGSESRALSLLEESAQHQLDNGLPAEAAQTFELAVEASTTDADRLRAMTGLIAALRKAADWTRLASVVEPAIELTSRTALLPTPHSDLELLQTEVMWRTESDLDRSLDRSLGCAFDETASPGHRAHAGLLAAILADNICRFSDLRRLNEVARALGASRPGTQAPCIGIQLIYESILGSVDDAAECGAKYVSCERNAGSVRALARALLFSCHPYRLLDEPDRALAAVHETLEIAERHNLVGEAASAADIGLTIHLERGDAAGARPWIARARALASRVGARYALASHATNEAIYRLLLHEPEAAMRSIEPYVANHLADPIVRQRMLYLSILARVFVSRGDHDRLRALVPSLEAALAVRRSTGVHDFHVASYAHALAELGDRPSAVAYVATFIASGKRDRTQRSSELESLLDASS